MAWRGNVNRAVQGVFLTSVGRAGLVVAIVAWMFLNHAPAAVEPVAATLRSNGAFVAYWVTLGVLSSVGLGACCGSVAPW